MLYRKKPLHKDLVKDKHKHKRKHKQAAELLLRFDLPPRGPIVGISAGGSPGANSRSPSAPIVLLCSHASKRRARLQEPAPADVQPRCGRHRRMPKNVGPPPGPSVCCYDSDAHQNSHSPSIHIKGGPGGGGNVRGAPARRPGASHWQGPPKSLGLAVCRRHSSPLRESNGGQCPASHEKVEGRRTRAIAPSKGRQRCPWMLTRFETKKARPLISATQKKDGAKHRPSYRENAECGSLG